MPVFNRAHSLGRAIDSLLAQTFAGYEIILVDDGSTDNSVEVALSYGDKIKLLKQENAGPGAARNTGINHAQGDYLVFLDSDDTWFPWTLQNYNEVIDQHDSPSLVLGKATGTPVTHQALQCEAFACYYQSADLIINSFGCCFAINRQVLSGGTRFNSQHINAEDLDLLMQIGTQPGFVWIQEPVLLLHKDTPDSAVTDAEKTFDGLVHMIHKEKNSLYPGGDSGQTSRRKIITRYIRSNALGFAKSGHKKYAWSLYTQTLAWHIKALRIKFLLGLPLVLVSTPGKD
jgi:hypothetical protein